MALVNVASKATDTVDGDISFVGVNGDGETKRFTLPAVVGAIRSYVTVAPSGVADYTTIAAALTAGHTVISLKNGGSYSGAVSITQDNVLILGNDATWTERTAGHTFTISGNNVTIQDLKSAGAHDGSAGSMTAYSMYSVTGDNCKIVNPKFTNLQGYGATFTGVNSGYVYDVNAVNVATDASDNFRIRYLIYVNGDSENVQVVGGNITGCSQGVGFWRGSNCKVALVRGIDNYGYEDVAGSPLARSFIEDYGAATGQRNNTVVHCTIDGSTSHGIECAQGVIGSTYAHNTIRNCIGNSIDVTGQGAEYTEDIHVFDNDIYDAACSVVGATNVHFESNRFYDVSDNITLYFQTDSVGGKATKNTFRNCGGASGGQVIRADAGVALHATGNNILDPVANVTGIYLAGDTADAVVEGNIIYTEKHGIEAASNMRIRNNTVFASASATSCLLVGGDNVWSESNTYHSAGARCVWANGGVHTRLTNDKLVYTGAQIALDLRTTLAIVTGGHIKVPSGITHIQVFAGVTAGRIDDVVFERPDGVAAVTDGSTGGVMTPTNTHLIAA